MFRSLLRKSVLEYPQGKNKCSKKSYMIKPTFIQKYNISNFSQTSNNTNNDKKEKLIDTDKKDFNTHSNTRFYIYFLGFNIFLIMNIKNNTIKRDINKCVPHIHD